MLAFLRWLGVLLAIALLVAAIAACGGGGDDDATRTTAPTADQNDGDDDDDGPTAEPGDDDDDDVDPGPAGTSVEVNETFWHAGFQVELGTALVDEEGVLFIDAVFHNLGAADNASLDSRLALRSGGKDYVGNENFFDQDIPAVAARGTAEGNFAWYIDREFSLDDATFIIGHPDNNQAIVPLGPDSPEELLTLEPQELTLSGQAVAGAVTVDLVGGEIRADLPNAYSIADKDHLELTLNFSVTVGEGIQIGQGVFQDQNVALRQPDGSEIDVRSDGQSGVNELLQGNEGQTIDDLSVRFEIEKPAPGDYAFIIQGPYGPGGAEVTDEIEFTVPELPTLGE
jgi:hypothetical protein